MAKLLRMILKNPGYQVVGAARGQEALDKPRHERPESTVLGVRMPRTTGYEVCTAVRRNLEFAARPVIMLTLLNVPDERILGIEAGATDIIGKPFNKRELMARLGTSPAQVRAGNAGILETLPGLVVLTDARWQVLALSTVAAAL